MFVFHQKHLPYFHDAFQVAQTGEVIPVKVLGCMAMIDEGEEMQCRFVCLNCLNRRDGLEDHCY